MSQPGGSMMDTLHSLFSHVCGQGMDHMWMPGGIGLPVCQRCTGLFLGAALAAAMLLWFRPRLGGWFLRVHGAFLLAMAPFGFHWVQQGPEVRTMSGLWFGAGVVVFLSLWPFEALGFQSGPRSWWYWPVLAVAIPGAPLLCRFGGVTTAYLLAVGITSGGLVLAVLVVVNAAALMGLLARLSRPLESLKRNSARS